MSMMRYVGIKNSPLKSTIAKLAPKIGKKVEIQLPAITADDCKRHFEILQLLDKGIKCVLDIQNTEYYRFNHGDLKRKDAEIWKKIQKFADLYSSIKKRGYDYDKGYIVLSTNGARIDGSHRGSIIEHLGFKSIVVLMVKWEDAFHPKELKDLYKHIQEQQTNYGVFRQ